MADASSSPPPYALRAPAASRGESITSQLQREILGDAAGPPPETAEAHATDADAHAPPSPATRTPTRRASPAAKPAPATPAANGDENDLGAISTPEALSQPPSQTQSQPDETSTTTAATTRTSETDRRRTLSPSKALAFFNQEVIADAAVAPSRRDTVSPESIRSLLRGLHDATDDGAASRRASVATAIGNGGDAVDDGVLRDHLQDVERTKQYVESSKQTLRQPSHRRRSSAGAPGATDQDSFTDAFFSTNLLSRDEGENDDENNTIDSVSGTTGNRRATLEPMDAQSMLSELRSEMMDMAADDEPAQTQLTTRRTRQSTSPSPSPNTRSRKRRATIDPVDLPTMRDGAAFESVAATVNANRRDTIGDGDLEELRREFGLDAGPSQDSRKRRSKSPSPAKQSDAASKRARFDSESDAATAAGDSDSRMSTSTPQKNKTAALEETDTLFSPPPTNRTNKTPLKSCLSARKAKQKDQTTPNKSVNFGPSQGAEFNLGSPSTSMTPMPARDARVMFPLDEKSPPVSDDDEETSLNTSLLEEADEQSSSDDDNEVAAAEQRKLSVEPSVSARSRRRYSLRGVSPLDNQANARRQRRLSAMSASTQQQSPLVSARNRRAFEAAATAAAVAASRGTVKTSFMSASEPIAQSRLAFADSSASSDEGEDMEITGDYTNQAATAATLHTGIRQSRLSESPLRSARHSARQDSLFADSPLADATVELGSLQGLLEENYAEEEKKQESQVSDLLEDDAEITMASLSDLAKEGDDREDGQRLSVSKFAGSQDQNLHPIVEGDDEDRRSSSAHSMMSLESDDESDDEYDKKRKSLVVNLSSKFERFGSGTPKNRKLRDRVEALASPKPRPSAAGSPSNRHSPSRSVPTPSPPKLPDPLRIEEVLARVELHDISRESVEKIDVGVLVSDVQRSCVAHSALSNLRFATNEVTSWCSGLADSMPALEREKVSRFFSTEDSDTLSQIGESIQSLQAIENVHVRSGYCHWRSKVEKTVCDSLVQCENKLASDAKTLRMMLESDRSYRQSELQAIKELMERERQMEQLLDGIEEQQTVQREYQSSVQSLENDCSQLSLEASVLEQQLASVALAAPQADLPEAIESKLRNDVLELEELLAVRESVGMWRVLSATGSKLAMVSRFDDVFFSVEVRVTVDAASPAHHSTFSVNPVFTTKTRRKKMLEAPGSDDEEDAVSMIAALILDKLRFVRYESTSLDVSQLPSQLGMLSTALRRAYQYLSDLRSISIQCGMRFEPVGETSNNLWVDFVRFPRVLAAGKVVDGVKFSVGHSLELSWPYTNSDHQRLQISYGTLTEEKLRQQLDEIPRQNGHDYLSRVCQRLRDVFIHDV